ncbi:MAG: YdbL family protein [Caulobacterales bacterium]|nr:YdbL family protein [Caulobacterales bacterium]
MSRFVRIAALAAILAAAPFMAASADDKRVVDAAKSRCEIGETISGYLEAVERGTSSEVLAAMNHINIQRRALYERLADQRDVTRDVVARLTGEKQISSAPRGQCVKDASGAWQKR